jgi:soluble lytic murein transglycosylase-like protein
MGPGQLMPGTARMLGVADPFAPEAAINASGRYLAEQLSRFGDVRLALAAYNAGPGAVEGQVPRNGETEFYVVKVMNAYASLRPPAARPAPNPVVVRAAALPEKPASRGASRRPVSTASR